MLCMKQFLFVNDCKHGDSAKLQGYIPHRFKVGTQHVIQWELGIYMDCYTV